ncbi:hypothetical protein [Caballeronia calidae]|uniref:hypothetical protein n=1 Tax=Caballeronia calidae TaxID=1777139 RepID=UPI0018DFE2AE|nr:hypothetical protein [Caballeronia calidae]
MPRATTDALSLRYHIALEAMRTGSGYRAAAHCLTALVLLTRFLARAGYGCMSEDTQAVCEKALADAFMTGNATEQWRLSETGYQHMAVVLNLHDIQLLTAPMERIVEAGEQLNRVKAAALCRLSGTRRARA